MFTHSLVDGLLGYFHSLARVHNAAVNIHVHALCGHTFSRLCGVYLGGEFLGHIVALQSVFAEDFVSNPVVGGGVVNNMPLS